MPHRSMLRVALIMLLSLVTGGVLTGSGAPSLALAATAPTAPQPAAPAPTSARPAGQPISGFFVGPGSTDDDNAAMLADVTAVGGDTVVTFGTTLRTGSVDSAGRIRTGDTIDPAFTACRIDGTPCGTVMTRSGDIRTVFTFANHSHFTGAALQCPKDRTFTSGGQRFTLLRIPTQGTGCTSRNGTYDLVAIHGGPAKSVDRTTSLLRTARSAGVRVYLGMPSAQKRTDIAWLPDLSYQDTLTKFTHRFLQEHRSRGHTEALAGFYHHTEMPVAGDPAVWLPVLELYRAQNQQIARVFPGKAALVSPYLDNRRSANAGLTRDHLLARTKTGARAIARTSAGVPLTIALQDGMGTGKAGAFHVNQADAPVDGPAAALVGQGTWGEIYLASVSESFSAARAGVEGTGAALWANIEAMTPQDQHGDAGCGTGERGQTTRGRLDQQVQAVGRYTAKNISFMWSPFYTCRVGESTLAQALLRRDPAPTITNAALIPERDVLWLAGYHLAGSSATVKYVDTQGRVQQVTSGISTFSSDYGQRTGLDDDLQSAGYPVPLEAPQDGKIFIVRVTDPSGVDSRSFALRH